MQLLPSSNEALASLLHLLRISHVKGVIGVYDPFTLQQVAYHS